MRDAYEIAWSPAITVARLGAVLCSRQQVLDLDVYLSLLADRIQRMVDLSDDPVMAATEFADVMERQGLWYPQSTPVDEIGNRIVWSNPAVHERLSALRVLELVVGQHPVEMPEAREQIDADTDDPHSRLLSWASLL